MAILFNRPTCLGLGHSSGVLLLLLLLTFLMLSLLLLLHFCCCCCCRLLSFSPHAAYAQLSSSCLAGDVHGALAALAPALKGGSGMEGTQLC